MYMANLLLVSFMITAIVLTFTSVNMSFAEEEHTSHESAGSDVNEDVTHGSEHIHLHEEQGGTHVHDSVTAETAQWVGVASLAVAGSITGAKARTKNKTTAYKFIVLTLSVGAGLMHLLLVPDHLIDVGAEHAKYFAISGIAQISFGILFMFRSSRRFAIIGMVGNIGSIALYWITRTLDLPAPLGAPEGIDSVGIVAKMVEISLVALLVYLAAHFKKIKPVEASMI